MKQAQLIEKETNKAIPLVSKSFGKKTTTIGRAEDNDVVLAARQVSRYHCRISQGMFGRWTLTQLEPESVGPKRQSATYVRRRGRLIVVVSGAKLKLDVADEISFGRAKGSQGVEFTHVFWLADV